MTLANSAGPATVPGERSPWEMRVERVAPETYLVRLAGSWRLRNHLPRASEIIGQLAPASGVRRLRFDTTQLEAWDTGLLTFLRHLVEESANANVALDRSGL